MSDATSSNKTAGAILREARQAQGLHIAALAASIKVAQKKLEALEGDRFAELPDATFTRALAQTVCRTLKVDPAPVLALLPAPSGYRIEQVVEGINAPFRDRPGRREPSDWSAVGKPALWGAVFLLIAAGVVYFLPSGWLANPPQSPQAASAPADPSASSPSSAAVQPLPSIEIASAPAADAASTPAASSTASVPTSLVVPSVADIQPAADITSQQPAPVAAAPDGSLKVHAKALSWVEVRDSRSKVLIARAVQAGETLAIDGKAPMRLKIGNARATEVSYRGQPLDIVSTARINVARIELK